MTSKKDLSERDICTQFILPALQRAGWDIARQVREEVFFTDGRIFVKGNKTARGERKRADFILYHKPNIPIAVIEAKDNSHAVGAGLQQSLNYARILDIPMALSSNGDGFVDHDRSGLTPTVEQNHSLDNFPSPELLWQRYKKYKGIETPQQEAIAAQDYFFDGSGRAPRYYQQIAVNRAVESIVRGQDRILLVMATGTSKTYTAFQIIHRLWKSGTRKRILFLADRNALIDQTKRGDFKHFKDRMTVIRKKKIDKAFEIYLALYQGLTNYDEDLDAYREFNPDFFDLIVVDECHRGSAAADSAWREILPPPRRTTSHRRPCRQPHGHHRRPGNAGRRAQGTGAAADAGGAAGGVCWWGRGGCLSRGAACCARDRNPRHNQGAACCAPTKIHIQHPGGFGTRPYGHSDGRRGSGRLPPRGTGSFACGQTASPPSHPCRHAPLPRLLILAATGINAADWTWAIRQLKEERKVLQRGEKRGARYRLIDRHGEKR
jgi:hypothetical protein